MKKKFGYNITCPNDETHQFPYVIQFEEDDKETGPRTFDVVCPFCKTPMKIDVKPGMKLPEEQALRGIKKD